MTLKSFFENKIRKFTMWDFAIFKIALVVFGMVLGAYFAEFVKNYLTYFIVIFVLSYIYILYNVFKK